MNRESVLAVTVINPDITIYQKPKREYVPSRSPSGLGLKECFDVGSNFRRKIQRYPVKERSNKDSRATRSAHYLNLPTTQPALASSCRIYYV